jgi:hypothetical protein
MTDTTYTAELAETAEIVSGGVLRAQRALR